MKSLFRLLMILIILSIRLNDDLYAQGSHLSDFVKFTPTEIQAMNDLAPQISDYASRCIIDTYEENMRFHNNLKSVTSGRSLGRYHGDQLKGYIQDRIIDQILNEILNYDSNRPEVISNINRTKTFLESEGMAVVPYRRVLYQAKNFLKRSKKATSCVTLARNCLYDAFRNTGDAELISAGNKILSELAKSRSLGTVLINLLQMAGWKSYYWNPDTSRNMEFDLFERYYQAIHTTNNGYHRYLYSKVLRTGNYLDMEYKRTENGVTKFLRHTIKVDDHETLVNFGRRTPDFLLDQQFYLGIAHQGFHVFMGSYGEVIEGHSKGKIDDELALERSYFNPLNDGTDYFKLLVTDNDKNFLYKNHIGKPSRLPTEQEYGKACMEQGLNTYQSCWDAIYHDRDVRNHRVSTPIDHIGGPRPFGSKDSNGYHKTYYRYRSGVIIVPPSSNSY